MSKLMTVLLILLKPNNLHFVNVDYCQFQCQEDENTACQCLIHGDRVEDLSNIIRFRTLILEKHNQLRNYIASGEENRTFAGSASNMNALNYDVELEYLARCYGGRFVLFHDRCYKTSKFSTPGQIIAESAKYENMDWALYQIDKFYSQIGFIMNSSINKFEGNVGLNGEKINYFTQIVWSSITHVGCARFYNPHPALKLGTYILICNYGGPKPANEQGSPVYLKGRPCTKCPKNEKCNSYYSALCGDIHPVPTDIPVEIQYQGAANCRSNTLIFTIFIILNCCWF